MISFLPLFWKIFFLFIHSTVPTTTTVIMLSNTRPPIIILTEPARVTDSAAVSVFSSEELVCEEERSIASLCEEVVLGGEIVLEPMFPSVAEGSIDAGLENVVECCVGVVILSVADKGREWCTTLFGSVLMNKKVIT